MRIRNVDKNWDWSFGHSQSDYTKDINAVELDIQMRLKEWYGDCFFNLQQGIPWDVRLGYKNQKDALDQDVINTVSDVEGVINVFNFTSSVIDRKYTCQFNVYTIYSQDALTIIFEG